MMQIMKVLEPIIQEEVERRVKSALQTAPQLVEERSEGRGQVIDNVQEPLVEKPKATKKKATETDEQKAIKAAEMETKKAIKAMEAEAKKAEIASRKAEVEAKKAAAKPKKTTVKQAVIEVNAQETPAVVALVEETHAVEENQELQPDVIEYPQEAVIIEETPAVAVKEKKTKKVTIAVAEGGGGVSSSDETKVTKKTKEPKKSKKTVQPVVAENEGEEELADLFQGMVLETLHTIAPDVEEEVEVFDL